MAKKASVKTVYDAAVERIAYCFREFDNVIVSFSGGKDSGVLLNLCYDYAKSNNLLHKLAMVHMDYEAQYQMTTDYVDATFKRLSDIRRFWLCLPIHAQCACRMDAGYWIPWEKSKRDIWCRDMPAYDYIINEDNKEFEILNTDYEIPKDFYNWFCTKYGRTVSLVGIRTQESYARQKVIRSMNGNITKYKGLNYVVDNVQHKDLFTAYPIYDWLTEDIWTANARFDWSYNKLYDLFYQAGLSLEQMRVASPFNDAGIHTLKLYKVIDPKNWARLVGRVNGASFAGLYGGTTAMGWKSITKPKGHTWKSYCYFLLSTMDDKTRAHYEAILNTSIKFWKEKGGAVSDETAQELKSCGTGKSLGNISKISDKEVIQFEEYPDDIPEVTNFREVPSYKRMCVCIMKNDYYCKYMGFAPTKEAVQKKKAILEKYRNL